jgi:glutamate-1-semialdehyde 2,1-aminomutase
VQACFFNALERQQAIKDRTPGSYARFTRAQQSLAGGVSSGLRRSARPYPLYFTHGAGSSVVDVDSNKYRDYGLAWGPLILGHAPPPVIDAVSRHLRQGLTFGAQHDLEFEVAELITSVVPCADLVSFANSGTEIVQVALRLARAVTGRRKVLKFEGHYHGWDDSVLVSYHPGRAEIGAAGNSPISVGAGQRQHEDVYVAGWNDQARVEEIFSTHGHEISAVICEPLLCNSGCIPPRKGFLEFLRRYTSHHGALLIFDEVITGFRLQLAGAQGHYGVIPDLATFAKAIGGGAPLSALAGKRDYMNWIASGKVIHAGTLNGNPMVLAAAKATLTTLCEGRESIYKSLWTRGERLRLGLEALLRKRGHSVVTSGGGPVFQVSFMDKPAENYRDTLAANSSMYSDFALAMLGEGELLLPDGRWYVSAAHTDEDIEATLSAAAKVLA